MTTAFSPSPRELENSAPCWKTHRAARWRSSSRDARSMTRGPGLPSACGLRVMISIEQHRLAEHAGTTTTPSTSPPRWAVMSRPSWTTTTADTEDEAAHLTAMTPRCACRAAAGRMEAWRPSVRSSSFRQPSSLPGADGGGGCTLSVMFSFLEQGTEGASIMMINGVLDHRRVTASRANYVAATNLQAGSSRCRRSPRPSP